MKKLSIIIPSYDPSVSLRRTLTTLLPLLNSDHEVIVIIDNENYDSGHLEKIEDDCRTADIRFFAQPNGGRAVARNNGAKRSTGEILLFLDDDMLSTQDLLNDHLRFHAQNREMILVGNGYRKTDEAKTEFDKYILKIEEEWKSFNPQTGPVNSDNFVFTACNMSLNRSLFNSLGGFDESLRDSEDFDLGARAMLRKIPIFYDRNITAWHNDWPAPKKFIGRLIEYNRSRKVLFDLHPEYATMFPFTAVRDRSLPKRFLLNLFRKTLAGTILTTPNSLQILPEKIRHTLFKIAVASYINASKLE